MKVTMVRADHSSGDLYGAETPIWFRGAGRSTSSSDGFRFYFAGDTDAFSTCA
jgi:hypothetical protein